MKLNARLKILIIAVSLSAFLSCETFAGNTNNVSTFTLTPTGEKTMPIAGNVQPAVTPQTIAGIGVAVTVVIVGGIIVYKLIQFFHSPAWQGSGTNTATTNEVSSVAIHYVTALGFVFPNVEYPQQEIDGYIYPETSLSTTIWNYVASQSSVLENSNVSNPGFTFQYGVDMNTNPFVTMNTMPLGCGAMQYQVANGSDFSFTMTMNMQYFNDIITYTSTNMSNASDTEEVELEGSGNLTAMDDYGDTASDYQPSASGVTNCVLIQRTWNLANPNWCNIYTDFVFPGAVSSYTDTQQPPQNSSPAVQATPLDGIIPPGSGTNGNGGFSSTSAFYRLAFPICTNQP